MRSGGWGVLPLKLLNLFKWCTRQLVTTWLAAQQRFLFAKKNKKNKHYWAAGCTTPSSYIYKRMFFLNHRWNNWLCGIEECSRQRSLGCCFVFLFILASVYNLCLIRQRHADDVAEMNLRLNMNKSILGPPISVSLSHPNANTSVLIVCTSCIGFDFLESEPISYTGARVRSSDCRRPSRLLLLPCVTTTTVPPP